MTAQDLINAAYRKCGIYIPSTSDNTTGLTELNSLLGMWSIEGLFPYIIDESFTLNTTTYSYSFSSSSTPLNTARPVKIINLFLRDSDGNDSPVSLISEEEYALIKDKDKSGKPTKALYRPEFTAGALIFNYVPDYAYTLKVLSEKDFTDITDATATLSLPVEYNSAITYNLAIALAENDRVNLPDSVYLMAGIYKQAISDIKAQTSIIPLTVFDMASKFKMDIKTGDFSA